MAKATPWHPEELKFHAVLDALNAEKNPGPPSCIRTISSATLLPAQLLAGVP